MTQAMSDQWEKQDRLESQVTLVIKAGGVLMGGEVPLDNLGLLGNQELMVWRESQALEGLGARLDQWELQDPEGGMGTLDPGVLEDLKEVLVKRVEEDLLAARVNQEILVLKVWLDPWDLVESLVMTAEMALESLDLKEEVVTKDSQGSLVRRVRQVTQALREAQVQEETVDSGVLLVILVILVRKGMLDTLDLMA